MKVKLPQKTKIHTQESEGGEREKKGRAEQSREGCGAMGERLTEHTVCKKRFMYVKIRSENNNNNNK